MIKRNKSIAGVTLVEALIWFAIAATIIYGVFSLYSQSRNASNAATVNKELSTIFSQTEQLFATEDTAQLTDGGNRLALNLGIYPKGLKSNSTGNTVQNVFGGDVTITGETPSGFTVTYDRIPTGEVCANIIRAQKAVGWDSVNGMNYDKDYKISDANTLCGPSGNGTLDLVFVRANTNS